MGSCHHHGKHKQHHPHNGAERRSVNGLRTEAQMADGDATTLFGIVLEVGLRLVAMPMAMVCFNGYFLPEKLHKIQF